MGASQSVSFQQYHELAEQTGFSLEQIAILHKRFKQLSGNEDKLRKEDFENIADLASNPIRTQVINAFFDKRNFYENGRGSVQEIGFEEFIAVMSHFKPAKQPMTPEQQENLRRDKLRFLFNMHDRNNDGSITLAEYRLVIEELLSQSGKIKAETIKSISDAAMLEVSKITVGHEENPEPSEKITFEIFQEILKGVEIENTMHIRFLSMNPSNMQCGK